MGRDLAGAEKKDGLWRYMGTGHQHSCGVKTTSGISVMKPKSVARKLTHAL